MKEFDLYKLVTAVLALGYARTSIMMQGIDFGTSLVPKNSVVRGFDRLFSRDLIDRARNTEAQYKSARDANQTAIREAIDVPLTEIITILKELDLPVTLAFAERFKATFEATDKLPAENELGELVFRLIDELRDRRFIGLSKELGALFNTQQLAQDVRLKFPSAVVDIDEAMNCLALQRSTASVFHFMRILEVGVRATATCLGIPNPVKGADKNWGNMINAIKGAIKSKWPTSQDKMLPDAKLFESLVASLEAVKNPWRNATMHVENTYTMDEAERIRHAVEGLMITMARRFDENGQPLV